MSITIRVEYETKVTKQKFKGLCVDIFYCFSLFLCLLKVGYRDGIRICLKDLTCFAKYANLTTLSLNWLLEFINGKKIIGK
jgi:hypothetical protein